MALTAGVALAACTPPHENDSSNREFGEVTEGPTQPSLAEVSKAATESSSAPTSPAEASGQEKAVPATTSGERATDQQNAPAENTPVPGPGNATEGAAQAPAQQGAQAPAGN